MEGTGFSEEELRMIDEIVGGKDESGDINGIYCAYRRRKKAKAY